MECQGRDSIKAIGRRFDLAGPGSRDHRSRRRTGGCLLLALALLGPSAAAREPARFQHGDLIPGRPPVAVAGIVQDSRGFLWLGSEDGLYRYDGLSSNVYRHDADDPYSLAASAIEDVLEDRAGELWIATTGGGLNRFLRDEERFEHFRHDPRDPSSLSHDNVWCLLEDHAGVLWIGATAGLNRFERRQRTFTRYLEDPGGAGGTFAVLALHEDASHRLWVGTNRGLARFDGDSFLHYRHDSEDPRSLSHDSVRAIREAGAGQLWIGTEHGLNRFDPETGTFRRYLHDPDDPLSLGYDMVFDLHRDPQGDLWIATFGGGLDRYHPETGAFEHHRNDPSDSHSLSGNGVVEIYEDRTGVLWLGTYGGFNKYDRRHEQFEIFTERTLGDNGALALWEEPSGILWVGITDGLVRIDRELGTVVRYPAEPDRPGGLPPGYVSTLWKGDGDLWVGTWGGLCRLEESRGWFHCYRHDPRDPDSLPDNFVRSLYEDRRGRLWVGTGGGLCELDRAQERFMRMADDPAVPESMAQETVSSILEDRSGTLWFASDGGLYRQGDPFEHFRHDPQDPDSLSSNRVTAIHEDRRGELWVATFGAGLNRLIRATRTFERFGERDGLPSATVASILEDEEGHLWLGTYNGLSRFDPPTRTFRNYDASDGLAGNILNVYSAFRGASGEMFFGSDGGLNAFFPDSLVDDPHRPPVVLTRFHLFDKPAPLRREDPDSPLEQPILETRELVLSHRQGVFAFEFAALSFRSPQENRYAYMLQGFDREWIETTSSQRFARYTNLDAGEYVFRVKAANADGVWNEQGASVVITVLPPPWKTWWATSLYVLALSAAVAGAVRRQRHKLARERELQRQEVERERAVVRRLREVDKLKDEFLANTSHELRTPLYGITGLAESLIDGARGTLPETVKTDLSMLVASGRRLASLVNDILDFSKLRHKSLELDRKPVDLRTVAEVVLTLSRPLAGSKDLELRNAIPPDLPPADADENRLQQILYNLIGNAIKFSESGSVEVAAAVDGEELSVSVTDSGIGIAEDQQESIFEAFEQADASAEREHGGTGLGLAVTRQLVELHGGSVRVRSAPGEGSTFSFTLPISTAEPVMVQQDAVTRLPAPETDAGDGAGASASEPSGPVPESSADSSSILVVDDEPVIRRLLANQLANRGYRITQAASGVEALHRIEELVPDLVLLDVMMPRMSGYEVCRKLRERWPLEDLPVLFLTAKNQVEDLVVGLAAGANDYLPKPISKNELLSRVKTHLDLLSIHRRLNLLVAERTTQLGERERLLRERERLVEELEERNAELARFNYTISHDLKSPVVTIKNFLGVLRQDAMEGRGENLEHTLTRLDAAADQMHRMLEELFEFSRVGLQVNPPEEVAFGILVQEALALLSEQIAERRIEVEVAADLPVVHGDQARLLEVVYHLLENAIKHRGDQAEPRVEVGMRRPSDGSEGPVFTVRDNGRGIDLQYHGKVFELFERLHPEEAPGTGIGLALVKRIVEVHGGRIWVESDGRGHGSTFCFTLG